MNLSKDISPLVLAALVLGIGIAGIPLGDAAGRIMMQSGPVEPVFIAWTRYGVGAILVYLVYLGRGFDFSVLTDWRLWLRALFLTGGIISILSALRTVPLATGFAAFFVGPILSYFGAALFLKERITWFRTITLLIAFAGVLIVVRPGPDMPAGIEYALIGGCFYAAFLVSTRWLAHVTRPRMLLMSTLMIGTLLLTPFGLANVPPIDVEVSLLVLWSAAASATGNLAIVISSALTDASRIAPLIYLQLVYAALFGFLLFGDVPDFWAWVGLAVLVGGGFASFFAQQDVKNQD